MGGGGGGWWGTHCLTASFVIQSGPVAVSAGLWDWTAMGLPLLSQDKGGRAALLLCKQLNTLQESEN